MHYFGKQWNRLLNVYYDFPRQFWILILGVFIDRLGGALLFPFFALYITKRFGVGMTTVGVLFAVFSFSSLIGNTLGGGLADHLGRKKMVLFGLVASALSSLIMGVVDTLALFFATALFVGIFADIGGPAAQAMVADLLPEDQRAQGYGIMRVVANLAVAIGPAIGGFVASQSYLLLFICDAVSSLITAAIVYLILRETRPVLAEEESKQSLLQTFAGYGVVFRDAAYMIFLLACMLMVVVYSQMYSTLSVYLRDVHAIPEQGYGIILSLNATMVVLFQFSITRRVKNIAPLMVMTFGTLFYAFGFSMYGWSSSFSYFALAMIVITIGEMLIVPVSQAIVAQFAPADKRGRYMAIYGFSWILPGMFAPLLAGLIMDNYDPRWVWYSAGILAIITAGLFALLQRWTARRATEAAQAA